MTDIFEPIPDRANAPVVYMGPNRITFLLTGAQTGGKFSLTEFAQAPAPAPAPPLHRHRDADETLYILDGQFEFTLGNCIIPGPPGAFIHIPKDTWHTLRNVGSGFGTYLVHLTPPGFEQFFAARARQIAVNGGDVDPAFVLALQEKYHVDMGGKIRSV
jgi:quercetin dioxygenase-like cupin family protein